MVCSFCTYEYDEEEAAATCGHCAAFGGCKKSRCPRCGYESPQTPGLLKLLRQWKQRYAGARKAG